MNFKIGDIVKLKKDISVFLASSKDIGKIIYCPEKAGDDIWYGIEFRDYIGGHDCKLTSSGITVSYGTPGKCCWIKEDSLVLVKIKSVLKIKEWIEKKNENIISAEWNKFLTQDED